MLANPQAILQAIWCMKTKSNRTRVYYRRITEDEELVKLMDSAILEAAKKSFDVAGWLLREHGVRVGEKACNDEGQPSGVQNAVMVKGTPSEGIPIESSQIKALLDDVERLTLEVADLKKRREAYLQATEDQKMKYWINRALGAESSGKKGEFDQT